MTVGVGQDRVCAVRLLYLINESASLAGCTCWALPGVARTPRIPDPPPMGHGLRRQVTSASLDGPTRAIPGRAGLALPARLGRGCILAWLRPAATLLPGHRRLVQLRWTLPSQPSRKERTCQPRDPCNLVLRRRGRTPPWDARRVHGELCQLGSSISAGDRPRAPCEPPATGRLPPVRHLLRHSAVSEHRFSAGAVTSSSRHHLLPSGVVPCCSSWKYATRHVHVLGVELAHPDGAWNHLKQGLRPSSVMYLGDRPAPSTAFFLHRDANAKVSHTPRYSNRFQAPTEGVPFIKTSAAGTSVANMLRA